MSQVARGAAEEAIDAAGDISSDAVGAVKRGLTSAASLPRDVMRSGVGGGGKSQLVLSRRSGDAVALARALTYLAHPSTFGLSRGGRMGAGNAVDDLEQVIEQYHLALGEFMKGNYEPAKQLFSEREDVTLGNPFGPFARGWTQVVETMKGAASNYRDGEASGFEAISKHVTPDLAYIVEVERLKSKVGGREDVAPVNLRVTTIFRREDRRWRIIHRHADPITTVQPAESVLQKR